ncbi:Bardet-Biedl syndrome 4 protein [Halyomorpha halys]|uniref:Bardet-Biedl syndrome 4 protein n=1 Tax=Halyomorpha halys TaxID=286706 RepID=UPI0006D50250|nr:Bardet-Biedl syndrome 4 protein [Halyomorpha halys]
MNGVIRTDTVQPRPRLSIKEPTSIESNNWLIHTRYVRKEFEICKLIIEEDLLKTKGCNEYAIYILGLILRHEGKVHESLECFQKCLFLNPSNVKNMKEIGRSWILLGQQVQAVEAFEEAEALSKSPDWNIYHNLGKCYASLGQRGKGREYLRKAVQLGKTEQSYLALAELHVAENDINSALEIYDIALRLFPSSSELACTQGLLLMKVGDYQKAFNKLGLAIAISPLNSKSIIGIASIFQDNNEFDVALSKFKIVGQLLPESVTLWNNMGLCFFGKGKYVAAISCLKRANYLDPLDWQTLYNLGLVHIYAKQYASAFHFLSSAVKLENKYAPSLMLIGVSLEKLGDSENALKCYEQGLKIDPDHIQLRINYISSLCSCGRKDTALEQLNVLQRLVQQSDEINPEVTSAMRKFAMILLQDVIPERKLEKNEE